MKYWGRFSSYRYHLYLAQSYLYSSDYREKFPASREFSLLCFSFILIHVHSFLFPCNTVRGVWNEHVYDYHK